MQLAGKPPKTQRLAPDGTRFVWGDVRKIHEIGRYQIVECLNDLAGPDGVRPTTYHPYIEGQDAGTSYPSLDDAILGALCQAHGDLRAYNYARSVVFDVEHRMTKAYIAAQARLDGVAADAPEIRRKALAVSLGEPVEDAPVEPKP